MSWKQCRDAVQILLVEPRCAVTFLIGKSYLSKNPITPFLLCKCHIVPCQPGEVSFIAQTHRSSQDTITSQAGIHSVALPSRPAARSIHCMPGYFWRHTRAAHLAVRRIADCYMVLDADHSTLHSLIVSSSAWSYRIDRDDVGERSSVCL
jgi:hypothetical protein